jgi:hypothetical protein
MNNTKQAPILHEDGISYLVPLTRGFFARIDAEDLEKVTRYSWPATFRLLPTPPQPRRPHEREVE